MPVGRMHPFLQLRARMPPAVVRSAEYKVADITWHHSRNHRGILDYEVFVNRSCKTVRRARRIGGQRITEVALNLSN